MTYKYLVVLGVSAAATGLVTTTRDNPTHWADAGVSWIASDVCRCCSKLFEEPAKNLRCTSLIRFHWTASA
jgi:hypothetical protein